MSGSIKRTLTSKTQRALIHNEANGHCQMCGELLDETWEADHILPFSITGQTNPHSMQALCRNCNRKKGSSVLTELTAEDIFEKHQLDLLRDYQIEFLQKFASSDNFLSAVMASTGTGKSAICPLGLKVALARGLATKILVVVPTAALRTQMARDFLDPEMRERIGHSFSIMEQGNTYDPSRNTDGYCITYQSAAMDSAGLNAAELERHNYLLCCDEIHHVRRGGSWHRGLQPLVERAKKVILLSGSPERGDLAPIALLPYKIKETQYES